MSNIYRPNVIVWSTAQIKVGSVTIPRGARGVIKKVEGSFNKKYAVSWDGKKVTTIVPKKLIVTY